MTQFTRAARDSTGSVSVELVLLTPVFLAVLALIVGAGRLDDAHGQLVGAARDAARAASQATSPSAAAAAATAAVTDDLAATACRAATVSTDTSRFVAGGTVAVHVTCAVTLADLTPGGMFPGHKSMSATATAPIDTYRQTSR
jgi:Flp pilus assembly protein TadG